MIFVASPRRHGPGRQERLLLSSRFQPGGRGAAHGGGRSVRVWSYCAVMDPNEHIEATLDHRAARASMATDDIGIDELGAHLPHRRGRVG